MEGANHLEDRPEGDSLPVREAAAARDRRLGPELAQEFGDQPGLADAGRAEHREELARAIVARPLVSLQQEGPLTLAPDHRRVEAPGTSLRAGLDCE